MGGDVHDDGVNEKPTAVVHFPMVVKNMWGAEVLTQRSMAYAIRTERAGSPNLLAEVRDAI